MWYEAGERGEGVFEDQRGDFGGVLAGEVGWVLDCFDRGNDLGEDPNAGVVARNRRVTAGSPNSNLNVGVS